MRRLREAGRFIASLLTLALVVVWGTNPILAQTMVLPGGGTWTGGAITAASSFLDGANFQLKNTADPTKILQFDVTGVTTGNTITPFGFGGTAAAPTVNFPVGLVGTPSIQFSNSATAGLWSRAVGGVDMSIGGGWLMDWGASTVTMPSTVAIGWSSGTTATNSQDALLKRGGAAAKIQMGVDLNGAAINQTFTACNGITGTDVLGCGLTQGAGLGTGAGVSNPYTITRQITKATGTTAQTSAPAMVVCPSKILSNTTGTVQTIATITTTTTTAGGLEWIYNVIASNGTALDSDTGDMNISWNNNAATVAVAASTALGDVQSNGSGTLTAAQTATAATNVISLKYTPAWTVIVPTVVTGFATFIMHSSGDTVVCQ